MNISSYTHCEEQNKIFDGRLSLMKGMRIVNADENIYRYLGDNAGKSMSALIHKEDLASFEDAAAHLDEGMQYIIARLMDYEGNYRYMYMIMEYNGRVSDGFREIDIDIQDIMAFHEKYDRIRASLIKYRRFMTFSPNMYMEFDYNSGVINFYEYSNGRSVTHFQQTLESVAERISQSDEFSEKQRAEFERLCELLKNKVDNIETSVDGAIFGIQNFYLTIKGGVIYSGEKKSMLAAVVTKTNYSEMEENQKYYMSSYALDPGTDAYNKRAIIELANDVLYNSPKKHYLCMMDVDDFKLINDTYGHVAGDKVIAQVSATIHRVLASRGYLGRFGGDEFLILTDKVSDTDDLVNLLKTIRKNALYSCKEFAPSINVTFSIGIAEYPKDGTSYDALMGIADKCLYIAKAKGKNRFIKYDPALHGSNANDDGSTDNEFEFKANLSRHYLDTYNMMLDAQRNGFDGIGETLDNIRNTFDIDGISIFDNTSFERKYMSGIYVNPYAKLDFVDRLSGMNDAGGVIAINKIVILEENFPEIYNIMAQQNTQCVAIVKCKAYTVVYDVFARFRKWSDNDKGMLMMLARAIDEMLCVKH